MCFSKRKSSQVAHFMEFLHVENDTSFFFPYWASDYFHVKKKKKKHIS